jgi:hypothetical protein
MKRQAMNNSHTFSLTKADLGEIGYADIFRIGVRADPCYNEVMMNFNLGALSRRLSETPAEHLAAAIVDEPFVYHLDMVAMGIGIVVFLIADPKTGVIYRVSLSRTHLAEGTLRMSDKKFEDIEIPLGDKVNIIARAIADQKPQMTEDWKYLFVPELTPEQARMNQAGGGIAGSFVYPVRFKNGQEEGNAALIFSYYKFLDKVGVSERQFMEGYSKVVGEALGRHKDITQTILRAKTGSRPLKD